LEEVDAERFGAQRQKNNTDNDVYRFEYVTHHFVENADKAQGSNR
jgi:hypothetical protein